MVRTRAVDFPGKVETCVDSPHFNSNRAVVVVHFCACCDDIATQAYRFFVPPCNSLRLCEFSPSNFSFPVDGLVPSQRKLCAIVIHASFLNGEREQSMSPVVPQRCSNLEFWSF